MTNRLVESTEDFNLRIAYSVIVFDLKKIAGN